MNNKEGILSKIGEKYNQIEEEYKKLSYEGRKKYWLNIVVTFFFDKNSNTQDKKIDIVSFRKGKDDIDLYLSDMINEVAEQGGITFEEAIGLFILDEQAKKAIEVQSNISNSSNQVENTISSKTKEIEGINISNEELVEKVGDLFYDSLSSFIYSLGENIDNSEISKLLEEASKHIMNAWNICLPYISDDFPEMKHTTEIKDINIDKQELAKRIGNLEIDILADFLEKLGAKIEKDGKADKGRGRIKLANELEDCANNLKEAGKILIK